jgi:hypothetical protein
MSQQTGFAVPKDRQEVTVRLDNGQPVSGAVFLDYAPNALTVHHRMAAFLEDENLFFPLQVKGGGTEFINKRNVKLVELNYQGEQEQVNSAISLMQVVNVTVFFLDGTSLNGNLIAEVPSEKARLSDCLNLPLRFLNIKIDGRISYLNKDRIRKVVYAPGS